MAKFFRTLGFVEGFSLLVLLFIAMPLKYLAGKPEAVRAVGMIHGMLFLVYVFMATAVASELKWSRTKLLLACVVSSVPFGPFVFDRHLFPRGAN